MLLILYGAASQFGAVSREYLQEKGFELVAKYSYAESAPVIESRHGERNYLPEEEFFAKTDSLFRYNVFNLQVGFNWDQIADAVYEGKNKLLTCSMDDINLLRKIKEVYKDNVKIIYCYIDTTTLEGLYASYPDITSSEYGSRMALGMSIKKCYVENADLFDSVVIYGGEDSLFNYASVFRQFDAILNEPAGQEEKDTRRYDIFLLFCLSPASSLQSNLQYNFVKELVSRLEDHEIRIYQYSSLAEGENWQESLRENILRSSVFIPVLSEEGLQNIKFQQEMETASADAYNGGLVVKPISFDHCAVPAYLENTTAYPVDSERYLGSIDFIEDWFIGMFSGEKTLKKLSEEVEACVQTSLYRKAFEIQGSYLNVLRNHLSRWHKEGTIEKINALLKYLDLAAKANAFSDGERIMDELLKEYRDELDLGFAVKIASGLCDFGRDAGLSLEQIEKRIHQKCIAKEKTKEQFLSIVKERFSLGEEARDIQVQSVKDTGLADKIASYSKASVELFEALFERGIAPGYKETLITAYNRIIDYCKDISLGNEITERCIDRVSELKSLEEKVSTVTEDGKKTLQSLKVYLGQALPGTGRYDVFISHKSADDILADKVYNYLKQVGLEVFCDHHTLGEMHDAEYDKRVTSALQNAKHLVLVASSPEYVKDKWVYYEWHQFFSEKREGYRNGNLVMVLSDELFYHKSQLPAELRDGLEIIKTSEFRDRLNNYLW